MRDFKPACAEEYKLNRTQGKTLMVLRCKGSRTMSELVCDLNIEKGSMTTVVDHLISRKLALRKRDQKDRRRVIIDLTASGRELAEDLVNEKNNHILKKLDQLGEERKESVNDFLTILRESIDIWETHSES
jgi:DNA-binding MarR family transcriptional regulator